MELEKKNKTKEEGKETGSVEEEVVKEKENKKEQYRIVIDKESNQKLEEMVEKVNEDFDTGMVSKSDLAMYVFLNLNKLITSEDIKMLRMKHFDDSKVLIDLLKISESKNELPEEVRKFLREHAGVLNKDKKQSPKRAMSSLAS